MKQLTLLRRTYIVPVVILALGLTAIGIIGTLQHRSDAAQGARLKIAEIKLSLGQLGAEPHLVSPRVGLTTDDAALDMQRDRYVIGERFRELRAGDPPAALAKAAESYRVTDHAINTVFGMARRGELATPAGVSATARQVSHQAVTTRALEKAANDYSARAEFARSQVTRGTVLTILLLLCVFAYFYARSVQEHRISRRLVAENEVLLAASRDEALTDVLTGLHNRRALAVDLERELPNATEEAGVLLALFDLDGFKGYNDTFGHAAGDELLHRLGRNLTKAAEAAGAKAYRLGGDEFCVLTQCSDKESEALIAAASKALTDEGEGWQIGTSVGTVWVPGDAHDVEAALVLADERMYSNKAVRKNTKTTLQSLADGSVQRAEEGTIGRVAQMSTVIAEHLRLPVEEIEAVRIAAGLHDIGKTAIPDSILTKDGDLDEDEWAFVRKHTIMGGRLVYASSERAHTASLVRSSHEHFDGNGYPDGLVGEQIPLGARIIAVCDAYNAMTSERPFRKAMTPAVALRELKSCSGTQFDPAIVDAFFASAAQRADSFKGTNSATGSRR